MVCVNNLTVCSCHSCVTEVSSAALSLCSYHLFQWLFFCLSLLSTYKASDHVNVGFTSNAIYQTPWAFQEHGPHSTQSIVMLFLHQERLFPLKFNQPFQVSHFIREESRVDIEQKSAAWLQESGSETKVHNNTQLRKEMDFLVWCERLDRPPLSRDLNLLKTSGMNTSTKCESHLVTWQVLGLSEALVCEWDQVPAAWFCWSCSRDKAFDSALKWSAHEVSCHML